MNFYCTDSNCECHQKQENISRHDPGTYRLVIGSNSNGPTIEGSIQESNKKQENFMSNIMTVEERTEFDKHSEKIKALNAEKRVSEVVQEKIIEGVFLRFLRTGKWKVNRVSDNDDRMRITPNNDIASERLMVHLLMETLKLNWHDHFIAFAHGVFIEGYVDDGQLSLYVEFYDSLASQKVQDGLAALQIDFDFGEMIKASMQEKLESLNRSIAENVDVRNQLLLKLKEME